MLILAVNPKVLYYVIILILESKFSIIRMAPPTAKQRRTKLLHKSREVGSGQNVIIDTLDELFDPSYIPHDLDKVQHG